LRLDHQLRLDRRNLFQSRFGGRDFGFESTRSKFLGSWFDGRLGYGKNRLLSDLRRRFWFFNWCGDHKSGLSSFRYL
jgi:hypothetical protein